MAQQHTAQGSAARTHRLTFNTDGRRHPLENSLLAVTVVLGIVAVTTAGFHSLHLVSSVTGLVGILTGAWGQYISVTTAERFALIIGLGMSALGFYLGVAHGGFS
ncbi:hypothetical protein RVR_4985 [Actinacidiphila reveromycinica]|uniref:Uncharacterized protein n=1 Tax=Actinacidiphila reveromycinica TaxID=659352 RepID=A0A7U3UTZ4_9ACTN|nr:hypothetical protein [Streptomyces sp. SN-593]BBA98696.1 hypothetical protein RVR_4985 [Streptomyces sp. SN-593]